MKMSHQAFLLALLATASPAWSQVEFGKPSPSVVDPAALAVPQQQARAWSEDLLSHLTRQYQLLCSVTSPESARAVLEPLTTCLKELLDMKTHVNDEALWLYIENTPGAKQPYRIILLKTSIEFQRLAKEQFYGCEQLRELLKPQMVPPPKQS